MFFIGILGDKGDGKTNLLTALLYRAHLRGVRVVSNYRLECPHTYLPFPELVRALERIEQDVTVRALLTGVVFGFDELSEGADSYEFMQYEPKKVSRLISQIRKLESMAYFTDQRWNKIAKRLRDQTDGFILCEDMDKHTVDHSVFGRCNSVYKLTFVNEDLRPIRTVVFDGKPYRDLYHTHDFVLGYDAKRAKSPTQKPLTKSQPSDTL